MTYYYSLRKLIPTRLYYKICGVQGTYQPLLYGCEMSLILRDERKFHEFESMKAHARKKYIIYKYYRIVCVI